MKACLTCKKPSGCGAVRGNCSCCYDRYLKRVLRGETTFLALEKKGLVLPAKKPHEQQARKFFGAKL